MKTEIEKETLDSHVIVRNRAINYVYISFPFVLPLSFPCLLFAEFGEPASAPDNPALPSLGPTLGRGSSTVAGLPEDLVSAFSEGSESTGSFVWGEKVGV